MRCCSVGCGAQIGPYVPKEKPEAEPAAALSTTAPSRQMNQAKERARLYRELLTFIQEGKGWVTSEPGCSPLIFESVDSSLADQLTEGGHQVTHIGQNERLTGFAGQVRDRSGIKHYAGLVTVQVWEIVLPGD